jgi:hypothetical protein
VTGQLSALATAPLLPRAVGSSVSKQQHDTHCKLLTCEALGVHVYEVSISRSAALRAHMHVELDVRLQPARRGMLATLCIALSGVISNRRGGNGCAQ